MKTLARPSAKKPVRARRPVLAKRKARLPDFMETSPISGLAVVKARPGQKPVTSAQIKALMAEFP